VPLDLGDEFSLVMQRRKRMVGSFGEELNRPRLRQRTK
jgi:hypothetical protein